MPRSCRLHAPCLARCADTETSQPQRVFRVNPVHERLAPVAVGDLVDQAHPVADDCLGGVVPGIVEVRHDQGLGKFRQHGAGGHGRTQALLELTDHRLVALLEVVRDERRKLFRFPPAEVAEVVKALRDPSLESRYLKRFKADWAEWVCDKEFPYNLDGEPMKARKIRFEVVPKSLRLIVPENCPLLSANN